MAKNVDPFDILAVQNQALQRPAKKKKASKPKVFNTLFGDIDNTDNNETLDKSLEDEASAVSSTPVDAVMPEPEPAALPEEESGPEPSSSNLLYVEKMRKMRALKMQDVSDIDGEKRIPSTRGRKPGINHFEGGSRAALRLTPENAKHLRFMSSRLSVTQSEYVEKLIAREKEIEHTKDDILRPFDLDSYDLGDEFSVQRSIFFTRTDTEWLKERTSYLCVSRTRYLNYLLQMDRL